jgi:hypothetical protein
MRSTMNSATEKSSTWSGTAHVEPKQGNQLIGPSKGAYVPVVGLATTWVEFRARTEHAMSALEFDLIDFDDVTKLGDVNTLGSTMRERAFSLSEANPIEFGAFHTFT